MNLANGYKTYIGAFIYALGTFLAQVPELAALSEPFVGFATALIAVGLGHKISKVQ